MNNGDIFSSPGIFIRKEQIFVDVYLCIVSAATLLMSVYCCMMIGRTRQEKAQLENRLDELENGASPSYEKAKQAAQAVNDFNAGISAILNFDPHEALKARRDDIGGVDG